MAKITKLIEVLMAINPIASKMTRLSNCSLALLFIVADVQKNNKTTEKRGQNSNEYKMLASNNDIPSKKIPPSNNIFVKNIEDK